MKLKRVFVVVAVVFTSALAGQIACAENVFERAARAVSELKSGSDSPELKRKAPNLKYNVIIPDDLPVGWRLSAYREGVFGGEVLVAEVGDRAKPSVLLVHGLGSAGMRDWLPVVPALSESYHLILVDLPGFGASATPPGKYSPTNYANVLAEIKRSYSPERTLKVVGHSLGGAITLRYAALYPRDLSSIVLVDAAGVLERTAFVKHNAELPNVLEVAPGKLNQLFYNTKDYGHNLVEILNNFPDPTKLLVTEGAWAKVLGKRTNLNAAFALVQEDFSEAIRELNIPTGIIWGAEDGIAPLRTGKLLGVQIRNANLVVIPEAGHVPMRSHTAQFNAYLSQLLLDVFARPQWQQKFGDLFCENQHGKTFAGSYNNVFISNCKDVKLVNLKANHISMLGSRVELDDVSIYSSEVGLSVDDSSVVATNLFISADRGIVANKSRLDFAGLTLKATKSALSAQDKTRVILSVGHISSGYYVGHAHGHFVLRNEILESEL